MKARVLLKRILWSISIPLALAIGRQAQAATDEPDQIPVQNARPDKAYLYQHPQQGYSLPIPNNVVLHDRGGALGIALKSREGYQITVQTNQVNVGLSLPGMLFRLESKYLGNGKPWSHKLGQQKSRIADLEAIEASYEGAGARVRVVIVRGARLDYVFIFLASPLNFQKLIPKFDWIIGQFRPAPGDVTVQSTRNKNDQSTPGNTRADMSLNNLFKGNNLGYSIRYPTEWIAERQGEHAMLMSGKPSTREFFTTISIQNLTGAVTQQNRNGAVEDILQDIKQQIVSADPRAKFTKEGPYVHSKQDAILQGGQFIASYKKDGASYRQWTIALARPTDSVIHLWSYAAPAELFLQYGAVAELVLGSWKISSGR